MLLRFKKWLEEHRTKRADWETAWRDADSRRADGRTNFQHLVLIALEPLVGSLRLSDSTGNAGQFLTGLIPGTDLTVYIYVDEVGAQGKERRFVGEKWDYDTPQHLVHSFVEFVRDRSQAITH